MSWTRLLTHTCNIVRAGVQDDYGHTAPDWANPAATTAVAACLMQPQVMHEQVTGAVIATHRLYLPYASAPATLLAHGAEKTHRVTQWVHGGLTDAGPFEIVSSADAGGVGHHLEITLKRAG